MKDRRNETPTVVTCACGHTWFMHHRPDITDPDDKRRCLAKGCRCEDFETPELTMTKER